MSRLKSEDTVEVDFGAFDFCMPRLTLPSSIGNGFNYISKFTTSKLSGDLENAKPLLDYLLALNHRGEVTMVIVRVSHHQLHTVTSTSIYNR